MSEKEIRYVAYDDRWLREILTGMREDLRSHMGDDRDAMEGVRGVIEELRGEVHTLRETVNRAHWVGSAAGLVLKWFVVVGGGVAGAWGAFQPVLDWIKR